MKKVFLVISLVLTMFYSSNAQEQEVEYVENKKSIVFETGFEFQGYFTGIIPGVRFETIINDAHGINLRLGYQLIRHRDLGEHDDERGNGYGFSLGYRGYMRNVGFKGAFVGIRGDIWFNSIDWTDENILVTKGTSDIVVFQPTIEAGYQFLLANDKLSIAPSLAFGWEWNVKTEGNVISGPITESTTTETGDGPILLAGFSISYRFGK